MDLMAGRVHWYGAGIPSFGRIAGNSIPDVFRAHGICILPIVVHAILEIRTYDL